MRHFVFVLLLVFVTRAAATGEINVLTDLNSPFPPGCIALSLPDAPFSATNELWDEVVMAPSVGSTFNDTEVRVQIWRVGCHDEGFSVVMVRLTQLSGQFAVLVPQVFAEAGTVDFPMHQAQLLRHPAVGNVGATANDISLDGITYMLGVDPLSLNGETDFWPEDYNDQFTLELFWGDFAASAAQGELFDILPYEPSVDLTQFETPLLHGRMTGNYSFEGIPFTGLQLSVHERVDDTNFIFAAFYTYLNGQPFWVVGSTGGEAPGFPDVELTMLRLTGGEFFGLGPDAFTTDDVLIEDVGTIFIEPLDCNRILMGYDFSPMGLGTGVLEGRRGEFSIAGYSCNPWQ